MGLTLALYYLTRSAPPEKSASGEYPEAATERPKGRLIWLHAPRPEDKPIVTDLLKRLTIRSPDLWFLVTSSEGASVSEADHTIWQPLPDDNRQSAAGFMRHWKPDVVGWLGDRFRPGLIAEAAALGIPMHLLDTGNALAATQVDSWIPGLRRTILRSFKTILAGDAATADAFRRAGASASAIRTTGVLELSVTPLFCLEAERDTLAQLFAARPVWLAAGIQRNEYQTILEAHSIALRRTHRLLLILVPSDTSDGASLAAMLSELDMSYELRSTGAEPEAETQVYVADTDSELGLWYRLAPTSFIGHSLFRDDRPGPSPFDAAALGSVVIHGPQTEHHRDAFLRLKRAGASREVSDAAELAVGVDALLAPDKAAEMAHSAWQICSAGAEVTDIVLDLLLADARPQKAGP